jgi:hypothetical protein
MRIRLAGPVIPPARCRSRAGALLPALGGTLVALLAWGCGGRQDRSTADLAASNKDSMPRVDPALCDTRDKRVVTFDLNRDGKPDVWKLYAQVEEGGTRTEVLTCKQVDYDKDGRKDYVAIYNRRGELVAEEFDFTFDGVFDARHHYDRTTGLLYMAERSSSHDRKPDTWEKYDQQGRLLSVERDRNGDGKPDLWEQYQGGQLIAILYDDDFDGRVDRRESARPAPASGSEVTSTTGPDEPVDTVEDEAEELRRTQSPAGGRQ